MKRIKYFLLLFFLLSANLVVKAQSGEVYTTMNKVNLYAQPNVKSEKLIEIPFGKEVKVEKIEGNWAYVMYYGRKGYVNAKLIKPMKPAKKNESK